MSDDRAQRDILCSGSLKPVEVQCMLYSGAAEGADKAFSIAAYRAGHDIVNLSFKGHRIANSVKGEVRILSQFELDLAIPDLNACARKINRNIARSKPYILNLLKRNYYQIYIDDDGSDNEHKMTTALYAVITKFDKGHLIPGGTSWAINMYLDALTAESAPKRQAYIFVEDKEMWYRWSWSKQKWRHMTKTSPPRPSGNYTGIGSREITDIGRRAIEQLYL